LLARKRFEEEEAAARKQREEEEAEARRQLALLRKQAEEEMLRKIQEEEDRVRKEREAKEAEERRVLEERLRKEREEVEREWRILEERRKKREEEERVLREQRAADFAAIDPLMDLLKELEPAKKKLAKLLERFEQTKEALNGLKAADFYEVKTFVQPPKPVELTLEAALIVIGEKDITWANAKKVMGRMGGILKILQNVKPSEVTDAKIKKLKKYIENDQFAPEVVLEASRACASLAKWIYALYDSNTDLQQIEPLMKRIEGDDKKIQAMIAKLTGPQKELMEDRQKKLQDDLKT